MNRMSVLRTRATPTWNELAADMEQVFDRLFNHTDAARGVPVPLEIAETADAYSVTMEVPGVRPEEISIEVEGDQLIVIGRRCAPEATDRKVHSSDRRYGEFRRVLSLPKAVDRESIVANTDLGVLTLTLPKIAPPQPRKIVIQAAAAVPNAGESVSSGAAPAEAESSGAT